MPKIATILWGNHGNCGDESYKLCYKKLFPQYEFTFSDSLNSVIKDNSDGFTLGGGNILFSPFTSQLLSIDKPKIALSVSVDRASSFDDLKSLDDIYVRDFASQRLLEIHDIKSNFIPDIAFCLEPNIDNGKQIIKDLFPSSKSDLRKKVIGVIFNAHLLYNTNTRIARDEMTFLKNCNELAGLFDDLDASIVFIPFGFGSPYDDRISNSWLASKCNHFKKNAIVFNELGVQETLDLVSACDIILSTRLHGLIFSCLGNLPFIDLHHHDKTKNFLETLNLPWSVNYWWMETFKLKEMLNDFLQNTDKYKDIVKLKTVAQKNLLNEVISTIRLA